MAEPTISALLRRRAAAAVLGVKWDIAGPGDDDRDPYGNWPRVPSRFGAAVFGLHRQIFRRCEVCYRRDKLTKTKATIRVPKKDRRLGAIVTEYVFFTWVCAYCLNGYYCDGTGA